MGAYNMFTDLKTPRDLTQYTLFRGTTDFSQLQQFDLERTILLKINTAHMLRLLHLE